MSARIIKADGAPLTFTPFQPPVCATVEASLNRADISSIHNSHEATHQPYPLASSNHSEPLADAFDTQLEITDAERHAERLIAEAEACCEDIIADARAQGLAEARAMAAREAEVELEKRLAETRSQLVSSDYAR